MKKNPGVFLSIVILSGMALLISCNLSPQSGFSEQDQEVRIQYTTVSALLTKTASYGTDAVSQVQPGLITPLPSTSQPVAPSPVIEVTLAIQESTPQVRPNGMGSACDFAQAGRPLDISIPDDTRLYPGEYFSKTWRLVNAGTCTWTQDYAVVWFSGNQLGLNSAQFFSGDVAPGSSVDVTLDMIAPLDPGTYQSNWKLRNGKGDLFGIGPQGDAPFWVRVSVVPLETPTPTSTLPLATPTPEIYASGTIEMLINQKADLDSGLIDQSKGNDLAWKRDDSLTPVIAPEDGALLAFFGASSPQIYDCLEVPLTDQPVSPEQIQEGAYFCYQTSEGLPGRILVSGFDQAKNALSLDFLTWFVP